MTPDRIPSDIDPKAYPLRRAFLLLSLPFTVLAIFVGLVVIELQDLDEGRVIAPSEAVERRTEGIVATPQSEAPALIDARNRPPEAWGEAEIAAFRALVERTGWPDRADEQAAVTRARLAGGEPSGWNQVERDSARELLDLFERYWFRQPSPRR